MKARGARRSRFYVLGDRSYGAEGATYHLSPNTYNGAAGARAEGAS